MSNFNILILQEGDKYVAQCLQHDIAAQGSSLLEAIDALQWTIKAEYVVCQELGKSIKSIPPAPNYFWRVFKEGNKEETLSTEYMEVKVAR